MIAIVFAVPQESRDFRERMKLSPERRGAVECWCGRAGREEIVVAHGGVGSVSATSRVTELLAAIRPESLIAAGFAGGLDPALEIGDLVVATNFTHHRLLARAREVAPERGCVFGPLVSEPLPAETVARKATLARATGALAVDMETAAIADVCAPTKVPMLAVRAISDRAGDPLPVPFERWFDLAGQRPRVPGLLWFLAQTPQQIAPFARFVRGLAPASRSLAEFLVRFLDETPSA